MSIDETYLCFQNTSFFFTISKRIQVLLKLFEEKITKKNLLIVNYKTITWPELLLTKNILIFEIIKKNNLLNLTWRSSGFFILLIFLFLLNIN